MEINLDKKNLRVIFFITFFLTIASPSLFPSIRLFYFAPFLVVANYQCRMQTVLWLAVLCGMIIDLLSSAPRLGIDAMSYFISMIILYRQKKNFFADSVSTLPLMTCLFSSLSMLITGFLLYIIDMQNIYSWKWLLTDVIIYPLVDAFYAFGLFILPAMLLGKRIRSGKDYFLTGD